MVSKMDILGHFFAKKRQKKAFFVDFTVRKLNGF